MSKGILKVKVVGDAGHLDKTLSGASGNLSKFGTIAAGAFVAAAAAAAGAGAAAFKMAEAYALGVDTIRIGTGEAGQSLAGFVDIAEDIAKKTPAAFAEVGTAVADLNSRLNLTGQPLEDLATKFLDLSRITKTDLKINIADLTRLFGDWSIAAEDQVGAMDKVYRASQSTGIGINQLAQQVVQFGAPLRQLGFGFEESIALFSKFEKEGVNIETVLAGMKMGLKGFAKAGEEPVEALNRAMEAIKGAASVAEANKIAFEVFGARAGPDMAAAIREGRFELSDLVKEIENGSDTIAAGVKDTWGLVEAWKVFKNKALIPLAPAFDEFFNAVGRMVDKIDMDKVFGTLGRGFDSLKGFLAPVAEIFKTISAQVKGSGLSFGDLSGALSTLNPIMGIFKDLLPQLKPLITTITDVLIKLAAQVLPILTQLWEQFMAAVLPAVEAILPILVQIIQQVAVAFGQFVEMVMPIIRDLMPTLTAMFQTLIEVAQPILTALLGLFQQVFPTIMDTVKLAMEAIQEIMQIVMPIIQELWDSGLKVILDVVMQVMPYIKDLIESVMKVIQGIIDVIMGIITGDWDRAWNGIKGIVEGVWGAIKAIVLGAWELIKGALQLGLAVLKAAWNLAWGLMREAVTAIWDGIKLAWDKMWGAMKTAWDTAAAWIGAIPGKIKAFFVNAGTWLYDIGKAVIQGFWDGLKFVWDKVTGWISSAGDKIKGTFKKVFSIFSPSAVFFEYGENVMEGFGLGLASGYERFAAPMLADIVARVNKNMDSVSKAFYIPAPEGYMAPGSGIASGPRTMDVSNLPKHLQEYYGPNPGGKTINLYVQGDPGITAGQQIVSALQAAGVA